jgi:erythrin-vacuolar iron transport family protein
LAIKREKEARDFYLHKSTLMSNPKFKELYQELADEEAGHITYLEVYRDTKGLPIVSTKVRNGQSFIPEFNITHTKQFIMLQMYDQQTTFPPEFDTNRTTSGEATLGDAGILVAAMRHERKSEDFYSELAKRAKDGTQRTFFEMLSRYERSHYEVLDSYLDYITGFRMQT